LAPALSKRIPLFWQVQILGWSAFAVLSLPLKFSVFGSWSFVIVSTLYREPLGLALTSCLRKVFKRQSINSNRPVRLAVAVLSLSLLAAAFDTITFWWIFDHTLNIKSNQSLQSLFCFRWLIYCIWSALYLWIKDQMESRKRQIDLLRAENATRDAEILMLRAQVSPHFLFNAFNAILADLERRPASLIPVVQGLSDYFRYSLITRQSTFVPLGDEFDAMANYLTVEKARFRESLVVETHIDPSVRSLLVPGIFLQPLVENALKFGHLTSPTPLHLKLWIAKTENGGAHVTVTNSGHWVPPTTTHETQQIGGCGLSNLRKRLLLLYQNENLLLLPTSTSETSVTVQLHLPAPA